ncbi:MAG: hypothetical protein ACI88H_001740 [Cocleimonas sp.]
MRCFKVVNMKTLHLTLLGFILVGLTACGAGGSNNTTIQDSGLSGLSECIASNANQAVVCGAVLANDGVTPLVNAEVTLLESNAKLAARGVANDEKCLTDGAGDFVCLLPSDISGSVVLNVSLNGFDDQTFTTNVSEGETTETGSQTLLGNTSEKWVVVPGVFDGVQVLLSQLKGCTLTAPNGASTKPNDMRGSADCVSKGLIVLDNTASITGFLATNELLNSDSLFS